MQGRDKDLENNPEYINKALSQNFDVEIDIWFKKTSIFLGHDKPEFEIDLKFLLQSNLWIHCKNIEAVEFCIKNKLSSNYFFHQNDDVTLTSNKYLWTFPGKKITKKSIAVMPEISRFKNIKIASGICSDFIMNYKSLYSQTLECETNTLR